MQKTLFDIIEEEGTIFKNRDVFNIDYVPEIYKFRDYQLESMIAYSKKLKFNKAPSNMYLKGNNATGKTSTLKKYFEIINSYFDNVITIHINCQIYTTEYRIYSKIYKRIFNKPIANLNSVDFHDEIMNYLIERKKILIIALDDYEVLKNSIELNKTLYSLLRAHETYPEVQIAIITITSKKENIYLNLNVSTLFLPIEIKFPHYRKDEIKSILTQRVELGFYPGVINENYLKKLINKTYFKGNIRYGIKKLEEDGLNAEFNGKTHI